MDNIIERIADHADIDTRRAMGFGPRKLVVPNLNIKFPKNCNTCPIYMRFSDDVELYIYPTKCCAYEISWYFKMWPYTVVYKNEKSI